MTAALEVGRWDERIVHPINADGKAGRAELARACAEVWLAALKIYYLDAQAAVRGVKSADLEALDDLTGSRRLLTNLCDPIDADAEVVADAMIEALDAGHRFNTGAMHRPVPERHDDYSGLDKWREKHKRRGEGRAHHAGEVVLMLRRIRAGITPLRIM